MARKSRKTRRRASPKRRNSFGSKRTRRSGGRSTVRVELVQRGPAPQHPALAPKRKVF